jgi:hypothetical protein
MDFADPTVVWDGDQYVAFATNANGLNVQQSTSPDLVHWSAPTDAVPQLPAWAGPGLTWAPGVAAIGGRIVLYVSVATGFGQCIAAFAAPRATGPFAPLGTGPLVCNTVGGNGVIDPQPFVAPDGQAYLDWKSAGSSGNQLYVTPLSPDGSTAAGAPVALLRADQPWEDRGIENPSMVAAGNGYLLLFSANWWVDGRYRMGYARCLSPTGPCGAAAGPWLASRDGVTGPGGGSLFTDRNGRVRLAFHAWAAGGSFATGSYRELHVEPVDVSGAGLALADLPPTGAVQAPAVIPGGIAITATATDPDVAAPVGVTVTLNGRVVSTGSAAPALTTVLGLTDGHHEVCGSAVDDLGMGRVDLGCVAVDVSGAPVGALDPAPPAAAGVVHLSGWAVDPDVAAAVPIAVYRDGALVQIVPAAAPRADVPATFAAFGANRGWSIDVPVGVGAHQVCAFAVDDGDRPSTALGCAPLTGTAPGT